MVDVVNRHAMVAVNKSITIGTKEVPTSVNPPRVGGVKVVPEASKIKPLTVGIMVERATRRGSVGTNMLTQTKPDEVEPTLRDDTDRATLKAQEEPERALPS